MGNEASPTSLPFQPAISFFRQKVDLPTRRWDDLWEGEHARAFTVAGATRDELLADLRASIDQAIAEGTTLETFRRQFDSVVAKHGWSYKGERNWRTDVMLSTNIRTAYQAGRYQQMTTPEMLELRPFWEYVHGDSVNPRPEHLAWSGLVLPATDEWWSTHFPPNGWGCKCRVRSRRQDELARLGMSVDRAPTQPDNTDGIDPGWAYNVGEANQGRPVAAKIMDDWAKTSGDWELLTPGDWESANRPERIAVDQSSTRPAKAQASTSAIATSLNTLLGGDERLFKLATKYGTTGVRVNAQVLAGHVSTAEARFLPYLPELLESPFEVWLAFERNKTTAQVALRYRYLKVVGPKGNSQALLLVATAKEGQLEGWSLQPADLAELQRLRAGWLLFGRSIE
jgi:hypothetical protein